MLVGYVACFHDSAFLHAEEPAAFGASVRLGLVGCRSGLVALADRANPAVLPDSTLEPFFRRLVVWEHLEELHNGDPFPEVFPGCLLAHTIL